MFVSNDWLAGIGTGLGVGAGAALITQHGGAVLAAIGVGLVAYVIGVRDTDEGDDTENDAVSTDGGTVPTEAAPEQPAVLNVEIEGDRVLAGCEKGDVAVVVEAPAGISADELEATLSDVPESIERTAELFDGGDSA